MSALTRAIYLAWSKSRLARKEVSFHAELSGAKDVLVRLAERAPHTLFSLYTATALKKAKRGRKITVLSPLDADLLLSGFNEIFNERINVADTPFYGSKTFKALKERFAKSSFDLFLDLDPSALPELAILSEAKLRIAYQAEGLFPYFNILFSPPKEANMHKRTQFMSRHLTGAGKITESLPRPQVLQRRINEWLKKYGHSAGNKTPYLLSSVAIDTESLVGMKVFGAETWIREEPEIKAGLLASASAYVGKPDRYFELAYLLEIPCLIILGGKTPHLKLPSSPTLRVITQTAKETPRLEAIEEALASLSL
jgi:hypothetical protein